MTSELATKHVRAASMTNWESLKASLQDLIDEIAIAYVPVLLGRGIPLFGERDQRLEFRHIETKALSMGLVQSRYERVRP